MEKKLQIDEMGRIKIPVVLLNELKVKANDNLVIKINNGVIVLSKKN